jgi:hypothetical protein
VIDTVVDDVECGTDDAGRASDAVLVSVFVVVGIVSGLDATGVVAIPIMEA